MNHLRRFPGLKRVMTRNNKILRALEGEESVLQKRSSKKTQGEHYAGQFD
jgi:hypothetical protein